MLSHFNKSLLSLEKTHWVNSFEQCPDVCEGVPGRRPLNLWMQHGGWRPHAGQICGVYTTCAVVVKHKCMLQKHQKRNHRCGKCDKSAEIQQMRFGDLITVHVLTQTVTVEIARQNMEAIWWMGILESGAQKKSLSRPSNERLPERSAGKTYEEPHNSQRKPEHVPISQMHPSEKKIRGWRGKI